MPFIPPLPIDGEHPPTLAIVDELKRIDATLKGFFVSVAVAILVNAPHLGHVVELLNLVRHCAMKKTFFQEYRAAALDVVLYRNATGASALFRTPPPRD